MPSISGWTFSSYNDLPLIETFVTQHSGHMRFIMRENRTRGGRNEMTSPLLLLPTSVVQIPAPFMMNPRAPPPPAFRVNNTPDSAGATGGHSAGDFSVFLLSLLKIAKH